MSLPLLAPERLGAQRPTWSRLPDAVVSSAGQEAVDLAAVAGIVLDDWQQWSLYHLCAERAGGTWAAFEAAIIAGRQNGKNGILEARELAGAVLFGDRKILHTAHRGDAVDEHHARMVELAESVPEFRRLVKRIPAGHSEQEIEMKGGRKIEFKPRARLPGRALTGDCVVFDEAFDLSPKAIGAAIPTLSTRPMAQVIYTSSAAHLTSHVLHGLIRRGRGERPEPRLFYAEWGNEPGVEPDDVESWYRANPALGIRISLEYVESEYRLMVGGGDPELIAEFARERQGISELPVEDHQRPIPLEVWQSLAESTSAIERQRSWALECAADGSSATIGIAGRRADGLIHTEFMERRNGTGWAVERCADAYARRRIPLRVRADGPAAALIGSLEEAGVKVEPITGAGFARDTGLFISEASEARLRHLGQRTLDAALGRAAARARGRSGARVWEPAEAGSDISALVACTLAVGGVAKAEEPRDPLSQIG